MRFLVIHAHPLDDSFGAALHRTAVTALRAAGHSVDDCDLYAEGFQPVLSAAERRAYHQIGVNRAAVETEIERLMACEGLLFVFPTWWYGMPAMLKGYIDRVWLPGVAFTLDRGRTRPKLQHITRFGVVTTYGSPWWLNKVIGDPCRSTFMRGMRLLCSRHAHTLWLAQYGMDAAGAAARTRFLHKVERKLRAF